MKLDGFFFNDGSQQILPDRTKKKKTFWKTLILNQIPIQLLTRIVLHHVLVVPVGCSEIHCGSTSQQ